MSESASTAKKKPLIPPKDLRSYARVRPFENLFWLALDYLTLAISTGAAIWFHFRYADFGLHWAWQIPVWGLAILINGCVSHRIGLMGHEASHNLLVPNRKWNDILAELFCFYPVYGSLIQYRTKHLPHHLHPNDPELDPNLGNGKAKRLYAKFPMPKRSFIYHYYLKFFWPPFVFANLLDLLDVITIGSGMGPVPEKEQRKNGRGRATVLGLLYLVGLVVMIRLALAFEWSMWWTTLACWAAGTAVWAMLPERFFVKSAKLNFSVKAAGVLRLSYYTVQYSALGIVAATTGWDPTLAYLLLWIVPLIYLFPYLMLLREIYQHANAGTGTLDNSRIIHADPFTRWAVLGYGNDFHLVHHIYPNIPQYSLRDAHDQLASESEEYRAGAEESFGILDSGELNRPSLLDTLENQES
ncbi:MAG: hypothetical protein HKN23_19250 [Verrucomicrobiales bacterium]|nr:hypothetical protein [Verrucomicrobiales bacterium]